MPSTIDIRRRIRSVKNTQQITRAMKMVATAKLRRAQERMYAARPYAGGLRQVLASVATRVDISAHPLLQVREPERNVVVIVVTADRGLCGDFIDEKIDGVYVVYNEFKPLIAQHVRAERLLPIAREFEADPTRPAIDYLYEPGPEQILSDLLPKHIEFQLYRVLLESAAAEQGARMTAMEAATKNASDMINFLTLTYNRIRQAAITKEIIEIVSGASAAQ